MANSPFYRAAGYMLIGFLALGVSHIAALPPFEGFDETAHYSYIQQLADTHALPRLATAKLSAVVEEFQRVATSPYAPDAPFESVPGHTYRTLPAAPAGERATARAAVHGSTFAGRRYSPGEQPNWQAQHPPFFYAALGPLYVAVREWPLGRQLFALRLVSFLFAWLALAVTVSIAARNPETHGSIWLAAAPLLWPVLFPSWFPEMARLGNDSLCALLVSALWALGTARIQRPSMLESVTAGALIGVGCLTKGLFVPVALGYFIHTFRRERTSAESTWAVAVHACIAAGVIGLIAGWWYWQNAVEYGVPLPGFSALGAPTIGLAESLDVKSQGGLIAALYRNWSLSAWVQGHAALVASFLWSGTWSLARPSYGWLAPLGVSALLAALFFLWTVVAEPRSRAANYALWLTTPVLVGLSARVLVRIALTGEGRGTPGHYLHFLVAPLATILGIAILVGVRRRFGRWLLAGITLYAAALAVLVTWAQLLLFGGIAVTDERKFYRLPADLPPWFGIPDALRNLDPLAYPSLAVVLFISGAVLVVAGGLQLVLLLARSIRERSDRGARVQAP